MNKNDNNECTTLINSVLNILVSAIPSSTVGEPGAQLRADVGALRATASAQLTSGTAAAALQTCFTDATAAGMTLGQMSGVLSGINALAPVSEAAIALIQLCVVLALSQESSIISAMAFTDRGTVETVLTQINNDFNPAIDNAADAGASDVFQALISLHATTVQFLVVTEQPLPFLVEYVAGRSLPSFVLAMRLYADTDDVETLADQLVAENLVVNPAFMPFTGIALSAP